METTLKVQVRTSYGRDRIYPMNDQAKLICELIGRTTLVKTDLAKLKTLGFTIFWVPVEMAT